MSGRYNDSFDDVSPAQETEILGGTDQTKIGNVGDRLKVDAAVTSSSTIPAFGSKTRVDVLFTDVNIPSGGGYTTIYTYSGSGYLIGFNVEFNSNEVIVRLDIDGETVFSGNNIMALTSLVATANNTARRQLGTGIVTSGSTIDWSLVYPIQYNTSVTISAATSGGSARTFQQGIVYLTKQT